MGTLRRVDKGRAQGCQASGLAGGTGGLGWDDTVDRRDGSAYFPGKGGVHFAALWARGRVKGDSLPPASWARSETSMDGP